MGRILELPPCRGECVTDRHRCEFVRRVNIGILVVRRRLHVLRMPVQGRIVVHDSVLAGE